MVHGAWHGAWCWSAVSAALAARGHDVVAVDLPCDEVEATLSIYADVIINALCGCDEDVVLVGHSLAGLSIPLVAARRPVRQLVFVCAVIPQPGVRFIDQIEAEPNMLNPDRAVGTGVDELGRRRWIDERQAHKLLYADCSADDARRAFEQLRPQAAAPHLEVCPLGAMPDVDVSYILCADDQVVHPAWSRAAARGRLGVDPIELPGSHSPFMSRPGRLSQVLRSLVTPY